MKREDGAYNWRVSVRMFWVKKKFSVIIFLKSVNRKMNGRELR